MPNLSLGAKRLLGRYGNSNADGLVEREQVGTFACGKGDGSQKAGNQEDVLKIFLLRKKKGRYRSHFGSSLHISLLFASVCENGVHKAWFADGSQWTHRLGGSRLSGDPVHLRCNGLAQDSNLVSLSNEVHSLHMVCKGRRQGSVHSKTRV